MDPREAVANKLNAEASVAIAEVARLGVETRKTAAEADTAEAMAGIAHIELVRRQREERSALAQDEANHVFIIRAPINFNVVGECIAALSEWSRSDPGCAIEVVITSAGGEVVAGMALFDFFQQLRAKGHRLTITAIGMVASIASVILQAGDWRVMGRETYLLIHEAGAEAAGKIGEIEDVVTFVKKAMDRVLDIYSTRATKPRAYFAEHWSRRDWWLDSDECLDLGLVDEVCSCPFPPAPVVEEKKDV
jgi:ATP-dependent Clp protease, protease subunit